MYSGHAILLCPSEVWLYFPPRPSSKGSQGQVQGQALWALWQTEQGGSTCSSRTPTPAKFMSFREKPSAKCPPNSLILFCGYLGKGPFWLEAWTSQSCPLGRFWEHPIAPDLSSVDGDTSDNIWLKASSSGNEKQQSQGVACLNPWHMEVRDIRMGGRAPTLQSTAPCKTRRWLLLFWASPWEINGDSQAGNPWLTCLGKASFQVGWMGEESVIWGG